MGFRSLSLLLLLPALVRGFHVGCGSPVRNRMRSVIVTHFSSDVNVNVPWIHRLHADASRRVRSPTVNHAFQSEYQTFFNDASRLGEAFISSLSPEERANRAIEGEQLENDIIDIATSLRRKADAMVAETGGVNFEVIRPLIDEISVLKGKYRVVVGATLPEDNSGEAEATETPGENRP